MSRHYNDVTLVTIETMYHDMARRALEETLKRLPFKNVLIFSDKEVLPGATHVKIEHGDMLSYCTLLLKGMAEHVTTSHMIFQQWDAMVHDEYQWTDEFLDYDYIGAPWPWQSPENAVGNGGFSLRSHRLLEKLQAPHIQLDPAGEHGVQEDSYICLVHKPELMAAGIKYAPLGLANRFSMELWPHNDPCMAHHGVWNIVRYMPQDVVEYFIRSLPKTFWNEKHRAHHTLVMLNALGYQYLIEEQHDIIMQSKQIDDLLGMLDATNQFKGWFTPEELRDTPAPVVKKILQLLNMKDLNS